MKLSDVVGLPFPFAFKHGQASFVIVGVLTFFPGAFLWLITLGMFRYFHLMQLYADFTVEQYLDRKYESSK